ncbi:hypothetical protein TNCV_3052351 [Trichonephila clavipes]|nr:hypothetical protein TNCV_3052351 [Trichonephila clavipes]
MEKKEEKEKKSVLKHFKTATKNGSSSRNEKFTSTTVKFVISGVTNAHVIHAYYQTIVEFLRDKQLWVLYCLKMIIAFSRVCGEFRFYAKHVYQEHFRTATAGSDVVQSGRPIFDDFFQHLWPYIGNKTANVVFQMAKRLWLIRIDQ